MQWWGWLIFGVVSIFILVTIFIVALYLTRETFIINEKLINYKDKRDKIEEYIEAIREYSKEHDREVLFELIKEAKIFQRLLGRFGIVRNFVKVNSNEKIKRFKVIINSLEEIKYAIKTKVDYKTITRYCSLMIDKLLRIVMIYNDLIDQMEELDNNDVKAYVYYLERIVILPFTVLSYIFTRPFTIANGDFNIYDKLDLNKGWQVARFILSICAELATVISLIITFIK